MNGIDYLFGTRHVDSPTAAANLLGLGLEEVLTVHQIHGDQVYVAEAKGSRPGQGFDAMVTNQQGLLLTLSTADCVPIFMADPIKRVVAAVHAGWRGSIQEIVVKTVNTMKERFGSDPAALWVVMGPSAGRCCYEVDETVLAPIRSQLEEWTEVTEEREGGRIFLDLRTYNRRLLVREGVAEEQIQISRTCTICSPEEYSSYRREGNLKKNMFSGIVLRS